MRDPLAPFSPAELSTLEAQWSSGLLQEQRSWLLAFCHEQRAAVLALAGPSPAPAALLLALQRLIVENGGVNHRIEMRAQIRAIHDEIWYRGREGNYDRERIAADWAITHGPGWRHWLLRVYVFVVARCPDEFLAALSAADPVS